MSCITLPCMTSEINIGYTFSSCPELILINILSLNMQNLIRKRALSRETKNRPPQAIVQLRCQRAPSCPEIPPTESDDERDISRCTAVAKMTEVNHIKRETTPFSDYGINWKYIKSPETFTSSPSQEKLWESFPQHLRKGMTVRSEKFLFSRCCLGYLPETFASLQG